MARRIAKPLIPLFVAVAAVAFGLFTVEHSEAAETGPAKRPADVRIVPAGADPASPAPVPGSTAATSLDEDDPLGVPTGKVSTVPTQNSCSNCG